MQFTVNNKAPTFIHSGLRWIKFVLPAVVTLVLAGCNQHRYEPADWRAQVNTTLPGDASQDSAGGDDAVAYRPAGSYFSGGSSLPTRGGTLPGRGGTLPGRGTSLPLRGSMTLPDRSPNSSTLPARGGNGTSLPARGAFEIELPGRLPGTTMPRRDFYPGGRLERLPPIRRGSTLPR